LAFPGNDAAAKDYRRHAKGAERGKGESTTRLTPRQAGAQQAAPLPSICVRRFVEPHSQEWLCRERKRRAVSWGWRLGKLGRSPSNRRCRFSGWIALRGDSQAAPLPSICVRGFVEAHSEEWLCRETRERRLTSVAGPW